MGTTTEHGLYKASPGEKKWGQHLNTSIDVLETGLVNVDALLAGATSEAAARAAADSATLASANSYSDGTLATANTYSDTQLLTRPTKEPVRAVASSNITLSGAQTIDGVSLVAGDRVLVAGQTTASQNGLYIVASGSWTRSTDANSSAKLRAGVSVRVTEGTAGAGTLWMLTTLGTITPGTTALTFTNKSSSGGGGSLGHSVKASGAVGDGTNDDTAAIQAAITAAPVGGIVYFDEGTYKITATLVTGGKRFVGPGVITTSIATAINVSGDGSVIEDITITSSGTLGLSFVSNAKNTRIRNVKFTGGTTTAIQINTTGVSNTLIAHCLFDTVGYGVLTNTGATDLRNTRILGNTFINMSADAVELNHPGTAYTASHGTIVANNYIQCNLGSGSSAGFGVGVAGAVYVSIIGNHFYQCRNQAVHLEDECAHISVIGNTIEEGNIGIWALDGDYLTIQGNNINATTAGGIQCTYDASNNVTHTSIIGNTVRNAGADGIQCSSDNKIVQCVITGNIVSGCTGNALSIGATNSGQTGDIIVSENILTDNTGYAISLTARRSMILGNNIMNRNTAGTINRSTSTWSVPLIVRNPMLCTTGVASSNYTPYAPMFALGVAARGVLVVSVNVAAARSSVIYDLSWDGTTLTTTSIGGSSSGTVSIGGIRANAGNLEVRAFSGTDGTTVTLEAALQGFVLL